MIAETERLRLRRLTKLDAPWIERLVNEPSFIQNIGDRNVHSQSDAERYLENGPLAMYTREGFGLWAVELRETNTPLGMCGLLKRDTLERPDIGFAFFPEFWGRGYALEAAQATMRVGKNELGMSEIWAITSPNNHSSIRLLEKLGFRFEKMLSMFGGTDDTRLFKHK